MADEEVSEAKKIRTVIQANHYEAEKFDQVLVKPMV